MDFSDDVQGVLAQRLWSKRGPRDDGLILIEKREMSSNKNEKFLLGKNTLTRKLITP